MPATCRHNLEHKKEQMNILTPISEIMTTNLITVNPKDTISSVKHKFDAHQIHHLPVVRYKELVGLISKSDLLYFMKGLRVNETGGAEKNAIRLSHYCVKDIMTVGLATVEPREPIRTALEIFKENILHALPVVQDDELIGIITTHDIIVALADEKIKLSDYKAMT